MQGFKNFVFALFLFGLAGGGFFLTQLIQEDTSSEDSDALFGGEIERNYLSGGYLINYKNDGSLETCGYTALDQTYGVTAGHCVENSREIRVGVAEFSFDQSEQLRVLRAVAKEGWLVNKQREDDFAILNFGNQNASYYEDIANIVPPQEGCGYKVVAYGRTENDSGSSRERLRKSATMCITDIERKIFYLNGGEDAGICFGDSGSPIYETGTNNLVGIVVSIVKGTSSDPNSPCDFDNIAIAVRADNNQDLINENALLPASVSVTDDGTVVATINESFVDGLLARFNESTLLTGFILLTVMWYSFNYSKHVNKDKESDL